MSLTPKGIETVRQLTLNHDSRTVAIKLVNHCLAKMVGLSADDMADTSTYANGLDRIEILLKDQKFGRAFDVAKDTAKDMIKEEGLDMFEENNKSKMKILTKELFSKLIREAIGDEFANLASQSGEGEMPDFNSSTEQSASIDEVIASLPDRVRLKLNGLDESNRIKVKSALKKALDTGRSVYDYNLYTTNKYAFHFFTDALAVLFKMTDGQEKENIRNALFEMFSPYPKNRDTSVQDGRIKLSNFGLRLKMMLGSTDTGEDSSTSIEENIIQAIYDSIDTALEKYDINQSFNSFLSNIIKYRLIDIWRKQNIYQKDGEKHVRQFSSLDANIDDDPDSGTAGDMLTKPDMGHEAGTAERLAKRIYPVFIKFIGDYIEHDSVLESMVKNPVNHVVYNELYHSAKHNTSVSNEELIQHIMDETGKQLTPEEVLEIKNKVGNSMISAAAKRMIFDSIVSGGNESGEELSAKEIVANISQEIGFEMSNTDMAVYKKRLVDTITDLIKSGAVDAHIQKVTGDRTALKHLVKGIFPLEACRYEFFLRHIATHLNEMKKIRDGILTLKEASIKLKKIDQLCSSFETTFSLLNEGNETQAPELYSYLKGFIDECLRIVNALQIEFGNVHRIVAEIRQDYPDLSNELSKQIEPLVANFFDIPEKLKNVVRTFKRVNTGGIQKPYNDKPYGI